MEINLVQESDLAILQLKGDLDASSSILLDEYLSRVIDEGAKKILVDFEDLQYISSAGLGVFVSYLERLKSSNIALVLFGMTPKVFNVFGILGIDKLMTIVQDKEKAAALLA